MREGKGSRKRRKGSRVMEGRRTQKDGGKRGKVAKGKKGKEEGGKMK